MGAKAVAGDIDRALSHSSDWIERAKLIPLYFPIRFSIRMQAAALHDLPEPTLKVPHGPDIGGRNCRGSLPECFSTERINVVMNRSNEIDGKSLPK